MLKEQLKDIKSKKKTYLRVKHGRIHFIDDLDMDIENILEEIEFKHSLFRNKSLFFDRHALSETEERKFNIKMKKFLLELANNMNRMDISYILEYLVRVYNIDTYNKQELVWLMIPHEIYEDKIEKLTYKENVHIKEYKFEDLARYFIYNDEKFDLFVQYFDYYEKNKIFLDKMLFQIAHLLKSTKTNFMDSFYKIFVVLKENNNVELVKEVHAIMGKYFKSKEFEKEYNKLIK